MIVACTRFLARKGFIDYNGYEIFRFFGMQGSNPVTSSGLPAFTGASSEDLQKITNFLLQLPGEIQKAATAEALLSNVGQLIFDSCDPVILFLAAPEFESREEYKIHCKSREDFPEVSFLMRNLLMSGIEGVSADFLDSVPRTRNLLRILHKSPPDVSPRLLIFVMLDDETQASWLRTIVGPLEQLMRVAIDRLYQVHSKELSGSYLQALHASMGDLNKQPRGMEHFMRKTIEQATEAIGACGCAILFPANEERSSYIVRHAFGIDPDRLPLAPALFQKAFEDFEAQSSKSALYEGAENEKFLMTPLLSGNESRAILFFYINQPHFLLSRQTLQVVEIFAFRLTLSMATAAVFREAFESQSEWENTFDSISDPIYIVDKEFRLKKINRSMAQVVNRDDSPLNRNCYRYLFQSESVCSFCPVIKGAEKNEPVTIEAKLFGSALWQMQSFAYRDKSGSRVGAIQVLRDLTVLKKMQEQLIETEKLASMGKLISGVAHEVRNPLFGISATARALNNELGGNENLQPYLNIITSETARLNRLMEDLLDYSRPVRIDKNPSDMTEIIQEVVDDFRHQQSAVNVKINFLYDDRVPAINVDRNKMKQVLFNLVENGIQHAGDQPQIDIFLEYLSLMEPPHIRIVIKDNGSGVSSENLPRIFDPFFTTRQHGTGLGLSIVRKVIHDHEGRIAVESHVGVGTTFRISLPIFVQAI